MSDRRKFNESHQEGLAEEAVRLRSAAELLPPGPVRDAVLRRARWAETSLSLDDWLNSPGLQPPTGR
ncbi:hypothetical protein BcanWSM471_14790 [Bradyrhizobium sp. WSM471]|nr:MULTISPECIES: hypothetical protein [Bradyrhizobium]UFW44266.1 hypothetical protein BcanWSM471_14790 [Bradyrhizobium canariense]